jgi:hypothetical protein
VHDLTRRMNSGVGSARARDHDPVTAEKCSERFMELALYRPLVALYLPAVEQVAEVGDLELQPTNHGSYPRTELGIA